MEWISVKDRLPLHDYEDGVLENYFVHFSDYNDLNDISEVGVACYITGTGWCYPSHETHTYWKDKITHWMEYPKAPQEFLDKVDELKRSIR